MISTSKIRRPPYLIDTEMRKVRRVSFLESSTGDVTERTGGGISESTAWMSREEPRQTLRPPPQSNDAKYDLRFGSDSAKPKPGPAAASASHLFRGSPPLHTWLAPGRGPAVTTNTYGSPAPPPPESARADVFDPLSKTYEVRRGDSGEPDGSEQPWLQSFGIGVLVAALVAAVITLALTADRPTATVYRKDASPLPRELEEIAGAGGNMISAPIQARGDPAWVGSKVMTRRRKVVATASTSRKSEDEDAACSSAGRREPYVSAVFRTQRPGGRRCGHRFYTYCEHERREAYFSDQSLSCVWSERDRVRVCNRGANRFPNLGTCLDSCAREPPRERCFESVLLTDCSRRDMVEDWWFFDGARCVQWDFPLGDCPSSRGGKAFRSLRECSRTCLHPRRRRLEGAPASLRSRCRAPVAVTCETRHIRFPYFADMNARGSARCVKASRPTLLSRLCLVGSNRFDSLSTCNRVCGSSPPAPPVNSGRQGSQDGVRGTLQINET
ncbi:hypothetical protein HPB50_021771 [Hyalomma asiaticum]|uniref:Uncharacterized protein n=1 Tax=Hyalomma asiaticum TaxID=266040 RepID=A0ACB7S4R9_HYAAI|nr:hypothetical protein HPB50_021771 [Hyalomma asiaticum]